MQTFRYGRKDLKFIFPVPNGDYTVELYFTEPWFGIGGGINCEGWRLFDVAVNDSIRIHNLDIWKEAGTNQALKKTLKAQVTDGKLVISFPKVNSDQAVVSAIAIATENTNTKPALPSPLLLQPVLNKNSPEVNYTVQSWLDTGEPQYPEEKVTFSQLPSKLFGAEWLRFPDKSTARNTRNIVFQVSQDADVYMGIDSNLTTIPSWLKTYDSTGKYVINNQGTVFSLFHKKFKKGAVIHIKKPIEEYRNYTPPLFIAAQYASDIMPGYDLKPTQHYPIKDVIIKGKGIAQQKVNNKEAATFIREKGDSLEWKIKTGIGAKYSIRFRYSNEDPDTKNLKFYLISREGLILQKEALHFTKTKEGKWNSLNIMTQTEINAGNYTVRLIAESAKDLSISGLDIQ